MTYQVVVLAAFCFLVSPLAPEAYTPEGVHAWVPMLLSAIQGGPQVVMVSGGVGRGRGRAAAMMGKVRASSLSRSSVRPAASPGRPDAPQWRWHSAIRSQTRPADR